MARQTARRKDAPRGMTRIYITRQKALKKLQLSIDEFRKLCILKGVFPRDPKKKKEGSDKTYYLRKDIDFLAHEKLIGTMRAHKAHQKKMMKAGAKHEKDKLRQLRANRPRYTLDHIVVERYPNFSDALAELDDPLCLAALFANLPGSVAQGIRTRRVRNCKRLMNEFLNYVIQTHALKKSFVSIKGYYYQAEIMGETLTWVSPHKFTQELPREIDYSIMLNFLELYECILNFVNFRLYTSKNLVYPPIIDRINDAQGKDIAAVNIEKVEKSQESGIHAGKAQHGTILTAKEIKAATDVAAEVAGESEDDEEQEEELATANNPELADANDEAQEDEAALKALLFYNKKFVLSRETPVSELEFVIRAMGGAVIFENDLDNVSDLNETLADVTHWVLDRPKVRGEKRVTIEYVQPQYIFDCVNTSVMLPVGLYAPGAKLPPHLSPFEDEDREGGYKPWFKEFVERIKAGDETVAAEAAAVAYEANREKPDTEMNEGDADNADSESENDNESDEGDVEDEEEEEEKHEAQRAATHKDEEVELKKMMMSKTKRRAYNSVKHKEEVILAKRRKLEKRREERGSGGSKSAVTKKRKKK